MRAGAQGSCPEALRASRQDAALWFPYICMHSVHKEAIFYFKKAFLSAPLPITQARFQVRKPGSAAFYVQRPARLRAKEEETAVKGEIRQ